MAVFNKSVFETLRLVQTTRKNIHSQKIQESFTLSDSTGSNIKILVINDILRLVENPRRPSSRYNLAIHETLTIGETGKPRVAVKDTADFLSFIESLVRLGVYHRLTLTETLTFLHLRGASHKLTLRETLTYKARRLFPRAEVIALYESLLVQVFPSAGVPRPVLPGTPQGLSPLSGQSITERPVGLINGINAVFLLTSSSGDDYAVFIDQELKVFNVDYTIAGNVLTFQAGNIPPTGSRVLACYAV